MRPSEVLDAQGDLIDRLDGTAFEAYLNSVYSLDETGHMMGEGTEKAHAAVRARQAPQAPRGVHPSRPSTSSARSANPAT